MTGENRRSAAFRRPNFAFDLSAIASGSITKWLTIGVVAYTVWDQVAEFDWRYVICMSVALTLGLWSFFRQAYWRYGNEESRGRFAIMLIREIYQQGRFFVLSRIHGLLKRN